jgi:anti-sigma regulatory factor (Ser/Thr protein kinase)
LESNLGRNLFSNSKRFSPDYFFERALVCGPACERSRMTVEAELFMPNSVEGLNRLMEEATSFLESRGLPEAILYKAHLVLEEVLTNIIKYAFDDEDTHTITVRLALRPGELDMEFEDDGRAFNPLALPSPQMGGSIEQAQVGGLGVHLVRQSVDSVEYRRLSSGNVLTTRFQLVTKQ